MGNGRLVGHVGRCRQARGHQFGQRVRALLRPIHADQMLDRQHARRRLAHRRAHIMGVDDGLGLVIGQVVVEFVDELDVDQGDDGADPPAAEHGGQRAEAVMGEDGDPVATAHAQRMKRASHMVHLQGGLA